MKRYLIAGLLVWVPLGVTVMVIRLLINLMDKTLTWLPQRFQPDVLLGFHIPGLGVVISVVVVLGTGMVVANLFGRKIVSLWEALLNRIPLVRTIYTGVKQILETVLHSQTQSFRKVLMIEYPRRGLWTMGFLAGTTRGEPQAKTGVDVVNVFIPTTPNPTSGFFLMVPKDEVIELDMDVDDGLKMIISAGVVVPEWTEEQVQALRQKRVDSNSEQPPV